MPRDFLRIPMIVWGLRHDDGWIMSDVSTGRTTPRLFNTRKEALEWTATYDSMKLWKPVKLMLKTKK